MSDDQMLTLLKDADWEANDVLVKTADLENKSAKISKIEFLTAYFKRFKGDRGNVEEHFEALPCTACESDKCKGWAMVGRLNIAMHLEDNGIDFEVRAAR